MLRLPPGRAPTLRRLLATRAGGPPKPRSRASRTLLLAALGAAATGLYFGSSRVHETADHVITTAQRVSVVAAATVRCFKIYKDVLLGEPDPEALAAAHAQAARITLRALERNGGIYIKLGQHILALTYLLPKEWTETMTPLQDQCPRSLMEDIRAMFAADMGVLLDEYFSEFCPDPVGIALLAQVHIATLRATGERVAVKVQHPSLARFVPLDVYLTQTVFGLMHRVFPEYPMTWLGDELQNLIYVELDFVNEAANAQRTAEQFAPLRGKTALRVPAIVKAEKRILIMEYVAGARLDNLQYMRAHGISPAEVSLCLLHIFNNMIFRPGFGLHCDPHPGNLAIRPADGRHGHNFEIVLYDHGLYRYIPLQMKRDYAHFWLAILDNNVPEMKRYAHKFTGIEGDRKFRIFAAAITGRDPDTALRYDISKARSDAEMQNMQRQLHSEDGVLEDLMAILSSMPRMVLLILKTNDLTRNLDETLENPLGPERTFLILAQYCSRAVYDEALEQLAQQYSAFSLRGLGERARVWVAYHKRVYTLFVYDLAMYFRNWRQSIH